MDGGWFWNRERERGHETGATMKGGVGRSGSATEKAALFGIVLCFLAGSYAFYGSNSFTIIEGDDFKTVRQCTGVLQCLVNPRTLGSAHQPLNMFFLKTVLTLAGDLTITTIRLIYLLAGAIAVLIFYRIVSIFYDQRISLVTTLLFAFHPLVLKLSSRATAYGPTLLLVNCHLLYLFYYLKRKQLPHLILSAVFISLGFFMHYNVTYILLVELFCFFVRFRDRRLIKTYLFLVFPLIGAWVAFVALKFNLFGRLAETMGYLQSYLETTHITEIIKQHAVVFSGLPHVAVAVPFLLLVLYKTAKFRKKNINMLILSALCAAVLHTVYQIWYFSLHQSTYFFARHNVQWVPFYLLGIAFLLRELFSIGSKVKVGIVSCAIVALYLTGTVCLAYRNSLPNYDRIASVLAKNVGDNQALLIPVAFWSPPANYHIFRRPLAKVEDLTRYIDFFTFKLAGKRIKVISLDYVLRNSRKGETELAVRLTRQVVGHFHKKHKVEHFWILIPVERFFGIDHFNYGTWRDRIVNNFEVKHFPNDGTFYLYLMSYRKNREALQ